VVRLSSLSVLALFCLVLASPISLVHGHGTVVEEAKGKPFLEAVGKGEGEGDAEESEGPDLGEVSHAEAMIQAFKNEMKILETDTAAGLLLGERADEAVKEAEETIKKEHSKDKGAKEKMKKLLEEMEFLDLELEEVIKGTDQALLSEEMKEKGEPEFSPVDLAIGLMLIGFITFIMILFTLVNHHDADMRYYAWSVISQTISIFVAVLMFTSMNSWLHSMINAKIGASLWVHAIGDFLQVSVYFNAMQLSVLYTSGARQEMPFYRGKKKAANGDANEVISVMEQKDAKVLYSQCWALLLSHTTGFANINFGAAMQHGKFFKEHPPLTFLVVPVMYFFHVAVGDVFNRLRVTYIKKIDPEGNYKTVGDPRQGKKSEQWMEQDIEKRGRLYALKIWDDAVLEAMEDVASLAISFLTVQACRFNISGVLPDNLGLEEENYLHSSDCSVKLFATGMVFAGLTCAFVVLNDEKALEEFFNHDEDKITTAKRSLAVGRNSMGTAFSWCMLYTCKWEMTRVAPSVHGLTPELSNPNSICSQVILALFISFLAYLLIRAMDVLADQSWTGKKTDQALFTIIQSLAILVGFSWEQSFDGGVEVIASMIVGVDPVTTSLVIAIMITTIVITPWRDYILKKVIKLTQQREEDEYEEELMNHDS